MEWFKRHRRKFLWAGAVSGGLVVAGRIAEAKFRQWQEEESRALLDRARRRHHFESTERTGHATLGSLFPSLASEIRGSLDSDAVREKLSEEEGISKDKKVVLWNELKVLAFARGAAYLMGGLYLSLLLRSLISILGGHLYRQETGKGDNNNGLSQRVQESFLSACSAFVSEEVPDLCRRLRERCSERVGGLSLKEKLGLADVEGLLRELAATEAKVDHGRLLRLGGVEWELLETPEEKETLKRLFADAMDVVENPDFQRLVTSSLPTGLSVLLDELAEDVNAAAARDGDDDNFNLSEVKLPVARLIPMLCALVKTEQQMRPDPLLMAFSRLQPISTFTCNIYEAFSSADEVSSSSSVSSFDYLKSFWGSGWV